MIGPLTLFQTLALAALSILVAGELFRLCRGGYSWRTAAVRCIVWSTAALSIARPDWIQKLANRIGIQRGADLVIYLLALAFLGTSFYLYARSVRLQRNVIELARELAILKAVGPSPAGAGQEATSAGPRKSIDSHDEPAAGQELRLPPDEQTR